MFITAVFLIAKSWKQPIYPSVGDWTHMVNIQMRDIIQYSKKKKNYQAMKRHRRNFSAYY